MYLDAGLLEINASFWIEVVAFLIMLAILARYVYPPIIRAAEARQRAVAAELAAAEKARQEAEERLQRAEARLAEARAGAQEIIASAGKSAEQLRLQLREKAESDARALRERAQKEIENARLQAVNDVRSEVASLVISATEKVIGETLDAPRHRKLIDDAIREVESGDRKR